MIRRGCLGRLYLEPYQEKKLKQFQDQNRFVWNHGVAERQNLWEAISRGGQRDSPTVDILPREEQPRLFVIDQMNEISGLRYQNPWLLSGPIHTQQAVMADLDRTYESFFRALGSRPTFWSKSESKQPGLRFQDAFEVERHWVKLPKIGWLRWRGNMPPGKIKSITLARQGNRWQISFLSEIEHEVLLIPTGNPIGIDRGVNVSLAISDGRKERLPVAIEHEKRLLKIRQRRVSKKIVKHQPASKNRLKAQKKLNSLRRYITNRVHDAQHKLTTKLAKNHSDIVLEALSIKNMTASAKGTVENPGRNVKQKSGLNRSMLEQNHYETQRQLAYKCGWYGSRVWVVPAAYTSQTCSKCGYASKANRKGEKFLCEKCGYQDHADVNAARVILQRFEQGKASEITIHVNVPSGRRKRVPARKSKELNASGDMTIASRETGVLSAQEPIETLCALA